MIQLTRQQTKKINIEYTFDGNILQNVDKIECTGETITEDLRWNTHVGNIYTKANRTHGFLRQKLYPCPQDVKGTAYKALVRLVVEYGRSVWDLKVLVYYSVTPIERASHF